MSGIRSRDTRPELIVRKGLHATGLRYQLHSRDLAGRPDLVFRSRRAAIFVHGCFWHGHDCHLFKVPGTRRDWWTAKIDRNRTRDAQAFEQLEADGWRVLTIWECSLRGKFALGSAEVVRQAAEWVRHGTRSTEVSGA